KIDDDRGVRVLEVARVRVPMSLINALRGHYDFGQTIIDQPNLVSVEIDENGESNLQKLAKTQPPSPHERRAAAKPQAEAQPTKLPKFRGNITINALRGTITKAGMPAPLVIDPSDIVLKIPDSNSPISNEIKLVCRVG